VHVLTDLSRLRHLGAGVRVFESAKIARPEFVDLGEGSQIDDFVFINGGDGVQIGRFNHIASFVSVVGGGRLITGDYVGIAAGARIITGTHHYGDGRRISPLIPADEQMVIRGVVDLRQDAFIGTNVIIHPNVTVGEGAIVGSGSLVLKDIEPWTINIGSPSRPVGTRPPVR
jgi:acetyltransferase-like isoleucine patch superfamily enzyme